jgi:hypothetical protein
MAMIPVVRTIEDRVRAAIERREYAVAVYQRSRLVLDSSRWLIASTRATLDRQRPGLAGGSGEPPGEEVVIRSRLRRLIDGRALPAEVPKRLLAGTCLQGHQCTACGVHLRLGEAELEWENPAGVSLFFHRRCVDLWAREDGGS